MRARTRFRADVRSDVANVDAEFLYQSLHTSEFCGYPPIPARNPVADPVAGARVRARTRFRADVRSGVANVDAEFLYQSLHTSEFCGYPPIPARNPVAEPVAGARAARDFCQFSRQTPPRNPPSYFYIVSSLTFALVLNPRPPHWGCTSCIRPRSHSFLTLNPYSLRPSISLLMVQPSVTPLGVSSCFPLVGRSRPSFSLPITPWVPSTLHRIDPVGGHPRVSSQGGVATQLPRDERGSRVRSRVVPPLSLPPLGTHPTLSLPGSMLSSAFGREWGGYKKSRRQFKNELPANCSCKCQVPAN